MDDPLLTPEQVAEFFQVTPYTVREWLKNGTLSGSKPTGRWRIKQSDVIALAEQKYGEAS